MNQHQSRTEPSFIHFQSYCERASISEDTSPDKAWVAVLSEETCEDGLFIATNVHVIQAVPSGHAATKANDVFTVDSIGVSETILRTQWLSASALQISVPSRYSLGYAEKSYANVRINVIYE